MHEICKYQGRMREVIIFFLLPIVSSIKVMVFKMVIFHLVSKYMARYQSRKRPAVVKKYRISKLAEGLF